MEKAVKGGARWPGRPPARGTRTIGMCSPGARARLAALGAGRVRILRAIEDQPGHPAENGKEENKTARARERAVLYKNYFLRSMSRCYSGNTNGVRSSKPISCTV